MIHLILGGNRSGKSAHAESIAQAFSGKVSMVVTAQLRDPHMIQRVQEHQARRDPSWHVVEESRQLANTLQNLACDDGMILVDCLTLWLLNLMEHEQGASLEREIQQLLQVLPELPGDILIINNEINLGVVPADSMSRRFCDELGRLNQAVAHLADKVEWVVAGIPMQLKPRLQTT